METRNNYVEENLKLVWKEVHRQIGESSPIDKDDAFQEGVLAMIIALERFDPSKGAKKSTYITNFVKGYIQMLNRDITTVHIPLRVVTKAKEVNEKGIGHLTIPQLAEELKTSYDTAAAALALSTQSKSDQMENSLFLSLTGDNEEHYSPYEIFEDELVTEDLVKQSIDKLSEQERKVITLKYFFDYTPSEIAKVIERTTSRVWQIEKEALRKLKKYLGGELSDYIA
ncbi:RNA polymerase sigma factor [Bacillus phage Bobb]|uniref:RNA polymerase sigma factor n=1 Tax=Bacillus phage Bobb TaxID=1527469 RepID=A0A076G7Q6_9CAUD|nr:RNA polymerase sigma factor [Bacillus phage Bobb]AII27989.1 RNA polymerase sigma factor [Bacillus phage Bobb]